MNLLSRMLLLISTCSVAISGFASGAWAGEIERFVEFRDGTRLKMTFSESELPWRTVAPSGESDLRSLSLDDFDSLELVPLPDSRKFELVSRALADLRSDEYAVRQSAERDLLQLGGRFRPFLEDALREGDEVDFCWRLSRILQVLPRDRVSRDRSDLLLDGSGKRLEGDVGEWSSTASAYGATLPIDRSAVCRISRLSDGLTVLEGPTVGLVQRILEDTMDRDPETTVRIDFEEDTNGRELEGTEDVSEMYLPWGCVLESSYDASTIALESGFSVRGLSRKFCAANREPKYRGIMTIRFCEPGNPDVPAGVRFAGLWVGTVTPGGTTLEAYDAAGRLLNSIKTTRHGSEFLALRSAVPIAYLRVVPNENRQDRRGYDPNYAVDDLVFDTPVPIAATRDNDYYTLVLNSGEVLRGRGLRADGETLSLEDLSVGIPQVRIPVTDLKAIFPPYWPEANGSNAEGTCHVMLEDGSVLRASPSPQGLQPTRLPHREPIVKSQIAVLWGESKVFLPPPDDWDGNSPIMLNWREAAPLTDVELKEAGVESPEFSEPLAYEGLPPIWLRPQPEVAATQGRVRLITGEEFVFSEEGFRLRDWSPQGVTLTDGEHEIAIDMNEVVVLVLDDAQP